MTTSPASSPALRTAICAAVLGVLVYLTQSRDLLRDFTRPVVMAFLKFIGMQAVDQGDLMVVGRLEVPWTRDCAGVNLLLLLLALAIWVNRHEKLSARYWFRIAAMLPASLLANIARVLTLIAWRAAIYPAVESPQTHYFLGLIWLVPFVMWITPRSGRPTSHSVMETLHAAAVVALLAPMTGTPNGSIMTVAAVVALTQCRVRTDHLKTRILLALAWLGTGALIALSTMDSFWLPWLLACPLLVSHQWIFSLHGFLILASTHALVVMQSWAWWPAGLGLALFLRTRQGWGPAPVPGQAVTSDSTGSSLWDRSLRTACMIAFALPFTAASLMDLGSTSQAWAPPHEVASRSIQGGGFELQLPGQSSNIGLVCYPAPGRDRHHTVQVCLKYRGVEITPVPGQPHVFTDGSHWLREFFMQGGHLVPDYATYVQRTFRPLSPPGEHLIFIADRSALKPDAFDAECIQLASRLHALCTPAVTSQTVATATTP